MARSSRSLIDMTPMVDVSFLLLIFFMSTTQFRPPETVAIDLPLSQSEIHVPDSGTIILTMNQTGQVFISSEVVTDIQELTPDDMLAAIVDWRSRNPDAVVIVKGDRDAPFGAIADLMDALARANALRFNLMTDLAREPAAARHGAASSARERDDG